MCRNALEVYFVVLPGLWYHPKRYQLLQYLLALRADSSCLIFWEGPAWSSAPQQAGDQLKALLLVNFITRLKLKVFFHQEVILISNSFILKAFFTVWGLLRVSQIFTCLKILQQDNSKAFALPFLELLPDLNYRFPLFLSIFSNVHAFWLWKKKQAVNWRDNITICSSEVKLD